VLSSWRRPQHLAGQIAVMRRQSVPPKEIWVWADTSQDNSAFNHDGVGADRVFRNSGNSGVYGRFAVALLARTPFVAIFDDDTMPGSLYLESCLDTLHARNGIVAAAGVQFTSASYRPCVRYGWAKRTPKVTEVDVGCNAWFLRREWLVHLWRESPFHWENGEDMQLSYCAQRYGGIRTFVPAQDDPECRGSLSDDLGRDGCGLCDAEEHYAQRSRQLLEQLKKGWRTVRCVRAPGAAAMPS
jgi:hypothetical protein